MSHVSNNGPLSINGHLNSARNDVRSKCSHGLNYLAHLVIPPSVAFLHHLEYLQLQLYLDTVSRDKLTSWSTSGCGGGS